MDERVNEHLPMKAVLVRIEGRVQGVWYRGWAVQQAMSRGLRGWVRNRADGSVETLLAGSPAVVDAMLAECRQGPPAALVSRITVQPAEVPSAPRFDALPTF